MPGRANDLIDIPDSFWQRPETTAALRERRIGRLFALLNQYTGASQTRIGIACGMSQGRVSNIIRGVSLVDKLDVFERIADGLSMPDPARTGLGLAPRASSQPPSATKLGQAIPPGYTAAGLASFPISDLLSLDTEDEQQEDDPMRRRTFVGLAGAAVLNTVFADAALPRAEAFAPVLAVQADRAPGKGLDQVPRVGSLTASVDGAWRQFSGGRYSELSKTLPALLARLHAACVAFDGEAQRQAYALSADAHRVAALLLLKLDDQGLAYLAADRSMHAAEASGEPVTIGTGATTIIAALMGGGHFDTAITAASTYADRLDHDMPKHTPESLSVYGEVVLRGAEAAAQAGKRDTAIDLLGEADETARRLGTDGNLRKTSFGPTNAKLWRLNLAVTLGDAGNAIDTARKTDLNLITTTERKATFLVDTARAFLQWGKHDKAYIALRAAEETAHEEVAGRPTVHKVVRELATTAPPSIRREAGRFAAQIGVTE